MSVVVPDWGPFVPFAPQDSGLPGDGRHHRPEDFAVIPGLDSDALLEVVYQGERVKVLRDKFGERDVYPQHRPETAGEHITVAEMLARCSA